MDLRYSPAYHIAEAARYLRVNPSTVRSWFRGGRYHYKGQTRRFDPILEIADSDRSYISFINLVEVFVLLGIRRASGISMTTVRRAFDYLSRELSAGTHTLANREFLHDRRNLYALIDGRLTALSERGQLYDEEIMQRYLERIEYGDDGFASRFRPVSYRDDFRPSHIVIDPEMSFGKPSLDRLGIKVEIIARRYRFGETIENLAYEYGANEEEIEEALRWAIPDTRAA